MKKLLVLALVLSVATMANAALVINTTSSGPLAVGETATLSISTDSPVAFGNGDWAGLALVADITKASITGGVSNDPLESGMVAFPTVDDLGFTGYPTYPAENGPAFMLVITGAGEPIGNLFTGITYTAGSVAGPVTVTLWGSQDYAEYTNLGSIVINQAGATVPEPMTLGLLALGGLFLRRK